MRIASEGNMSAILRAMFRKSTAARASVARSSRRCALVLGVCVSLIPAVASSAEIFDDWRDGDLVAQNRLGSREASLWSLAGSRYNHIGIIRLTGGGPYVLDLTNSASEVPVEDFVARGAGAEYAIYRVSRLSYRLGARAAAAAWQYSDRRRDDFLASDRTKLTDTGLVHQAFEAVGVNVGLSRKIGDLPIPRSRLREFVKSNWEKNRVCSSIGMQPATCLKVALDKKIVTMASILNDRRLVKIYSSLNKDP